MCSISFPALVSNRSFPFQFETGLTSHGNVYAIRSSDTLQLCVVLDLMHKMAVCDYNNSKWPSQFAMHWWWRKLFRDCPFQGPSTSLVCPRDCNFAILQTSPSFRNAGLPCFVRFRSWTGGGHSPGSDAGAISFHALDGPGGSCVWPWPPHSQAEQLGSCGGGCNHGGFFLPSSSASGTGFKLLQIRLGIYWRKSAGCPRGSFVRTLVGAAMCEGRFMPSQRTRCWLALRRLGQRAVDCGSKNWPLKGASDAAGCVADSWNCWRSTLQACSVWPACAHRRLLGQAWGLKLLAAILKVWSWCNAPSAFFLHGSPPQQEELTSSQQREPGADDLERTLLQSQRRCEELERKSVTMAHQCENLERMLAQSQRVAEEVQARADDLERTLLQSQRRCEELERKSVTMAHQCENLERMLAQSQRVAEEAQARADDLEHTLLQSQRRCEELERKSVTMAHQCENLEGMLARSQRVAEEAQARADDLERTLLQSQRRCEELERKSVTMLAQSQWVAEEAQARAGDLERMVLQSQRRCEDLEQKSAEIWDTSLHRRDTVKS